MNIKTDLQTLNGYFIRDMQFKYVLLHIYVKVIKFDLFDYQMFSWLSGIAQGMVIKRREFESCLEPSIFFSD